MRADDARDRKSGRPVYRRDFLALTAGGAISGILLTGCTRPGGSPWRFFTPEEASQLESVVDRIIPPDVDPGAAEAQVVRFIDLQLVSYYRAHQETYRRGLAALAQTALQLKGESFTGLSPEEQDKLLIQLESDEVPVELWSELSSSAFFSLLIDHTMQGFYGPPRHGGNRELVAYQVVGLPYPQILGRVHPPDKEVPRPHSTPVNQAAAAAQPSR